MRSRCLDGTKRANQNNNKISENQNLKERLMCDFLRFYFRIYDVSTVNATLNAATIFTWLFVVSACARSLMHGFFCIIFWRCSRTSLVDLNKNVKFIIIWNGNDDNSDLRCDTLIQCKQFCALKTGREGRPHQWHTGTTSV